MFSPQFPHYQFKIKWSDRYQEYKTVFRNRGNQNPATMWNPGLDLNFETPKGQGEDPSGFWSGVIQEIPTCTKENCGEVAVEVDSFFPYLDDYNRCKGHRLSESLKAIPIA